MDFQVKFGDFFLPTSLFLFSFSLYACLLSHSFLGILLEEDQYKERHRVGRRLQENTEKRLKCRQGVQGQDMVCGVRGYHSADAFSTIHQSQVCGVQGSAALQCPT